MKSRFNTIILSLMLACGLALGGNLYLMNMSTEQDVGVVTKAMPDNSAAKAAAKTVRTKALPQVGQSGGARGKRVQAPSQ